MISDRVGRLETSERPIMTTVRSLLPTDRPAWDALWAGYLRFYECDLAPAVTERTWARFFDPSEPMEALVAEHGDRLVGLVHMVFHPSTWVLGTTCYLEDLFVAEDGRGQGVGRALIEATASLARARGAGRLYWLTHETNRTAQALYDRVARRSGFVHYLREPC